MHRLAVPGTVEGVVDQHGETLVAASLPQQPQLEGVHLAAALDALVAGVPRHVVELVLLEQIRGRRGVALVEQALRSGKSFGYKLSRVKRFKGIPGIS